MSKHFTITQRHYDTIIQQAQVNYPQECGGFIGGNGLDIKAILPVFNQHLFNKTDTYAVTSEDITRAHQFFAKHSLSYMGIYHTHPKGSATPSKQDLSHIQDFMFIISLRDQDHPDFAAYVVKGKNYKRLPLVINKGPVEVVDLHGTGQPGKTLKDMSQDMMHEIQRLDHMFHGILTDNVQYPKMKPRHDKEDRSGFSTIA